VVQAYLAGAAAPSENAGAVGGYINRKSWRKGPPCDSPSAASYCATPSTAYARNFAYVSPMALNSLYFSLECQASFLSRLSHVMITIRDFGGSPSNVVVFAAGNDVASAALLDEFRLPRRVLFHVALGICHLVL
jgi:hypothetical protein